MVREKSFQLQVSGTEICSSHLTISLRVGRKYGSQIEKIIKEKNFFFQHIAEGDGHKLYFQSVSLRVMHSVGQLVCAQLAFLG